MKTYSLQRRIAAKIMGVGKNKVWFDPSRMNEMGDAITSADIEDMIKNGAIKKLPSVGVKRRAGKRRQERKKKRSRGSGKKKKIVGTRKRDYINKIRKLRAFLAFLKGSGKISQKQYCKLRLAAKAGSIKTKADINNNIKNALKITADK